MHQYDVDSPKGRSINANYGICGYYNLGGGEGPLRGSQQSLIKLSYKFKQITVYTVTNVRDLVGKRG